MMTAFQKPVEMPVTRRADSYAPADFAERILPVHPTTPAARTRLNYATHFSLGGMWGSAYGIAASAGLRGQQAANAVFAVVYPADVLVNTALRVYPDRCPAHHEGRLLAPAQTSVRLPAHRVSVPLGGDLVTMLPQPAPGSSAVSTPTYRRRPAPSPAANWGTSRPRSKTSGRVHDPLAARRAPTSSGPAAAMV